jgi:hypothetical protein
MSMMANVLTRALNSVMTSMIRGPGEKNFDPGPRSHQGQGMASVAKGGASPYAQKPVNYLQVAQRIPPEPPATFPTHH